MPQSEPQNINLSQTATATSPSWSTNTKLVVGLTAVVIAGTLLVKFQFVLSPLLIALVLAYLFHPAANWLQQKLRFSWTMAVGLIYIVIIVLLLGLLTLGGVGLVQQIQSVVAIAQDGIDKLPGIIEQFSGQVFRFGPFSIDFRNIDLHSISSQLLDMVQPFLSRTGTLVSAVAGSAAGFLGWTFFVILVSYFVLAESGGSRRKMVTVDVPGYTEDISRLSRDLGRIWNAFLRGQIIIFVLAVIVYSIVLSVFGVRYAVSLAFMAGLARFVPYVGPAINYLILIVVAYFQVFKLFNLEPLYYTTLVVIVAVVIDQIFDNVVTPRILSSALKVHPAAVLVAAIIAANLMGLLGVVIAAPMLATVTLFWRYTMRKLLDLNPWPEEEPTQPPPPMGGRVLVKIRRLLRRFGILR
ncbi:MAG: AI-2E family transporter [Anaerolineales bacterium]|nr:AI-2E family transporter [Anaerolineales bacterium]MCZ2123047.1 AI-2E family transporter [Anaerolineales bacterium]